MRFWRIISSIFWITWLLVSCPSLVLADNSTVTLTIPPRQSDFQFSFSSLDPEQIFKQNTLLTYQITYGSKLSANLPTDEKIIVDYSHDADALTYVLGSATSGYGGAAPVIDILHKTITWSIPAFPQGTIDQLVTFQFKTTGNYQGANTLQVPITASMSNEFFSLPYQSLTQVYQFDTAKPLAAVTATVTPTPLPDLYPTVSLTKPSAKKLQPSSTFIRNVAVTSVTADSLRLSVETRDPTTLRVFYGTTISKLVSSVSSLTLADQQEVQLSHLSPHQTYYVQLMATNSGGNTTLSDVYSFTTAEVSTPLQFEPISLVFTSSDIVLSEANNKKSQPVIVLPADLPYSFRFQLQHSENISHVEIVVRDKNVLGMTSSDTEEPNTEIAQLIESSNGVFEGRLQAPQTNGSYQLFVRMYDTKGNVLENPLADLYVSNGLSVLDEVSKKPIEGAQILLYYKNPTSGSYEILPPDIFPLPNPAFTNLNGNVSVPLPVGAYKAKITALGYAQKEALFSVGTAPGDVYPTFLLKKSSYTLLTTAIYYGTIVSDSIRITRLYVQSISNSTRFFELNAWLATAFLVLLSFLSFSRRIQIPFRSMIYYFKHLGRLRLAKKMSGTVLKGSIVDSESGEGILGCDIYLIDTVAQHIVGHTTSDKTGNFGFSKIANRTYSLEVMKSEYGIIIFHESEMQPVESGGYLLRMSKIHHPHSLIQELQLIFQKVFAVCFEGILLLSLLFEFSLGYALGFEKTLVFLCFSVVNLLLWILHLTHLRSEKNIF